MAGQDAAMNATLPSWIVELRARLENPPPVSVELEESRAAAVLVPLFVDAGQLWVLLTKRADTLSSHRGQIAFPGGGLEEGEDAWAAALRESQEEIGLEPKKVLKLGQLDAARTHSGYHIVPCVGVVPFPLETLLNKDEIEEVFPVPIAALANPQMVEDRTVDFDGVRRVMRVYHVGRRQIWGYTARVLENLLFRLGIELPQGED
jgi:8-oxo-dGTP pyrophosphatase MutT (NUDIX family)